MSEPRTTGPAYDPQYPRHLNRAQAEEANFYTSLGRLAVTSIESILNGRVTGYECPACGTWTYGYPTECGKCGRRRGIK